MILGTKCEKSTFNKSKKDSAKPKSLNKLDIIVNSASEEKKHSNLKIKRREKDFDLTEKYLEKKFSPDLAWIVTPREDIDSNLNDSLAVNPKTENNDERSDVDSHKRKDRKSFH